MTNGKTSQDRRWSTLLVTPTLVAVGLLIALGGGSQTRPLLGTSFGTLPVLVVAWAFALNWIAYLFAYRLQSERFYDLIGSTTFLSCVAGIVLLTNPGPRLLLALTFVALWSLRMAFFLVRRIHKDGKDGRFDTIKPDPVRFLNAWSMQASWVFLCLLPVLILAAAAPSAPLSSLAVAGAVLWVLGFAVEVVSDQQKSTFRANADNKDRFISSGLWSLSRHPNYVGEILLWTGITVMAIDVVAGWQWMAIITPVFVFWLLRFVSGVPLLEKRADDKWGGVTDYEAYKQRTPILFPFLKGG